MLDKLFLTLVIFVLFNVKEININRTSENKEKGMNNINLMNKRILMDSSPVLFEKDLKDDDIEKLFTIHHSKWVIRDNWLIGENSGNWPGMAILRQDFPGNVLVEFDAQTIMPSTHDINVMRNGEWLEEKDQRGIAYVAGLQGWWTGKVGIEKSDEYRFMVGTGLFRFVQGKVYHIQAGSIDGHCFILADGKLLLEAMDPDPIDNRKYCKVGFEAYSSKIKIKNIRIRQIKWERVEMRYEPEF
jgi:hypothetical protein